MALRAQGVRAEIRTPHLDALAAGAVANIVNRNAKDFAKIPARSRLGQH
jgi:hypothetical protein